MATAEATFTEVCRMITNDGVILSGHVTPATSGDAIVGEDVGIGTVAACFANADADGSVKSCYPSTSWGVGSGPWIVVGHNAKCNVTIVGKSLESTGGD